MGSRVKMKRCLSVSEKKATIMAKPKAVAQGGTEWTVGVSGGGGRVARVDTACERERGRTLGLNSGVAIGFDNSGGEKCIACLQLSVPHVLLVLRM